MSVPEFDLDLKSTSDASFMIRPGAGFDRFDALKMALYLYRDPLVKEVRITQNISVEVIHQPGFELSTATRGELLEHSGLEEQAWQKHEEEAADIRRKDAAWLEQQPEGFGTR